ncbi:hypothetical protein [Nodularia sphaerocarpa]|uniref:hypothetical protein n=1 Tax=Nodularia sphaerocarpa TaxID=137816 RepID=UPI001EFC267A|nr:hypothetical protein [Nodularia sphaerocarpa]MDB9372798.1 hypothetical protein [Nodularia sphaerocarpa CS-585]ULP74162.1 hypothetical protein BDGGKGIB_03825 [Nodularia sphaerocarpa UHCC 0038]
MSFRILRQVPLLQARYAEYQRWLALTPQARQSAYAQVTVEANRASHSRTPGYCISFNTAGATEVYLKTKILSPQQEGAGNALAGVVRGLVASRVQTTAQFRELTNPLSIEVKKYKFAKLALTTVTSATTQGDSRITGVRYRKPDVDTATSNFGGLSGTETFQAASTAISGETAFTGHLNAANFKNRAKFTPEG